MHVIIVVNLVGKIDASHVTVDISVGPRNIELPIAESESALKSGPDTVMVLCYGHSFMLSMHPAHLCI